MLRLHLTGLLFAISLIDAYLGRSKRVGILRVYEAQQEHRIDLVGRKGSGHGNARFEGDWDFSGI
jgi:hypothetical protein